MKVFCYITQILDIKKSQLHKTLLFFSNDFIFWTLLLLLYPCGKGKVRTKANITSLRENRIVIKTLRSPVVFTLWLSSRVNDWSSDKKPSDDCKLASSEARSKRSKFPLKRLCLSSEISKFLTWKKKNYLFVVIIIRKQKTMKKRRSESLFFYWKIFKGKGIVLHVVQNEDQLNFIMGLSSLIFHYVRTKRFLKDFV